MLYDSKIIPDNTINEGIAHHTILKLADHLLDNGIVVPPVKVGQTVYIITEVSKTIIEVAVIGVWQCASNTAIITEVGTIHQNSIGKTVFTSREEALAKLKEGKNNG
jgi:hypothetical protein